MCDNGLDCPAMSWSLTDAGSELGVAARRLRRRPGYAAAHVTLLAVSIGVNAAVFALYDHLFLRPLPFGRPDGLVCLLTTFPSAGGTPEDFAASPLDFVRWRERSRRVEDIAVATPRDVSVGEGETAASVPGEMASASLFALLGSRPILGRTFTAEEDREDGDAVVLGHGLWARRFGADPGVVGRTVRIDGAARTVVGVMPPGFQPTFSRAELWLPLGIDAAHLGRRASRYLATLGRLKPGVTPAQAQAELAILNEGLRAESPATHAGWGVRVTPMREFYFGPRRPAVVVLLMAVAALLLVACSNLAHLALTHAVSRRGELALRLALGASRARLLREPALEALVLGAVGAALGLALAFVAIPPAIALDAELGRLAGRVRPDAAVVAFAAITTVLATALVGVLPAWRATRGLLADAGAAGSRVAGDRGDGRLRQALVVGQVTLSLVLLCGAALLVKGLLRLREAPRGFRSEGLVAAQIVLPASRYQDAAARTVFMDRVLERVRALPGVTAAATTMTRFHLVTSMRATIVIEGRATAAGEDLTVHFRRISPGYVAAMATPLVAGRDIEATDGMEAPGVALVNESFVRQYLGGRDPLGHRLRRGLGAAPKWLTIVGVVADVKDVGLVADAGPTLYTAYAQNSVAGVSSAPITLLLRGGAGTSALAAAARSAVAAVDRDLAIEPPAPVEEHLASSLAPQRLQAGLLAAFALTAVVLAAIGLYGVTSYAVAQRTREIGIRVALGASGRAVSRMVVGAALRAVVVGTALGALATWGLRWALGRVLEGAPEWDARTVVTMAAVLILVAAAAAYIPARRSARLDPAVALREGG